MATCEGSEARAALERSVLNRVPPLLTDLYQFTMAYAYWRAGRHNEPAVFELFFRDNPFGGGFSLIAGLSDCLLFLQNFAFSDDDVEYLRSILPAGTDAAFFSYLKELDCSSVSVSAVPEGSVVFARVPLLEVSGPLAVVQLLETSLLCLVNYASLVCSNAARFRLAAGPRRRLMEMGLRRAQGPDGGLTASRYTYIGGVFVIISPTSVQFSLRFIVGSRLRYSYYWIAFTSHAITQIYFILCFSVCSFSVPQFESLIIVGTNSISEQSLAELNKKDNEIDVVGVGTHLVTCTRQPSLGCVYKLIEVRGRPRMKMSEDPEKSTLPGRKSVYRLLDADGHPHMDLICLSEEPAPKAGVSLNCFPLGLNKTLQTVTPAQVTSLRLDVFTCGQITFPLNSASESRERAQMSLQTLHPHHKRLQEPHDYTVALSERLHSLVSDITKGNSKGSNFLLSN
ncbi:nicotinate phosphoribosyltransferase-like [Sinocyclocheilus rhinocerous]|uniref:nicotinate phosphoribosyltransferase-like n=1 Tax=Sinocyclocheilus rhinocerous TaxID=307959 RepID=UPI0007B791D5|nr:PREDICTED: nicotinate phosphoribosyltransferase-like [Sinocyclocheilus rhinocerous]